MSDQEGSGMRHLMILIILAAGLCPAQTTTTAAERRQAILDYQLTTDRATHLISAMEAMTKYVVGLPDYQERLRKSMTMTSAEQLAKIEEDPKAAAILKQNNLTARDYVIGVPALRMALLAAQGVPPGPKIIASDANIAFAKAHLAELKPKMDAADGIAARK